MTALLLALLLSPTDPPLAGPAKLAPVMGDLAGVYSCEAGKAAGSVTIHRIGSIYHVVWVTKQEEGLAIVSGTGIVVGEVFSVGWSMQGSAGTTMRGVTTYRLRPGPGVVLDGRWASIPGTGDTSPETLRLLGTLPMEK